MPDVEERLKVARKRYVLDNRPLVTIAQEVELDFVMLQTVANREHWDAQRVGYQMGRDDLELDVESEHERISKTLLRQVETYAIQLCNDTTERATQAMLRSKIESLRALAEASAATIKVHREAKGLKPGTPSVPNVVEEEGVKYVVSLPPRSAEIASA